MIGEKNLLTFKEPVDGHEILAEEGQSAGERRAPKRKWGIKGNDTKTQRDNFKWRNNIIKHREEIR